MHGKHNVKLNVSSLCSIQEIMEQETANLAELACCVYSKRIDKDFIYLIRNPEFIILFIRHWMYNRKYFQ